MELQVQAPAASEILAGAKRLAQDVNSPLGIDHVTAMVLAKWLSRSYSALRLHCFNVYMTRSYVQAGYLTFEPWLYDILDFAEMGENARNSWKDGVTKLLPALYDHPTFEIALELGEKKWQMAITAANKLPSGTPHEKAELHDVILLCNSLDREALSAEFQQRGLLIPRKVNGVLRHVEEKPMNDTYHADLSGGQRLVLLYIALKEGARIHCETYGQRDGLSRQAVAHQLALLEAIGKEHVDLVNVDGKWFLREFLKDDECPRDLTPVMMVTMESSSSGDEILALPSSVISTDNGWQ